MIRRETDAGLINRIANDSAILPHFDLGRTGALDFTPCLMAPDDYIVLSNGKDAAAMFEWSAPNVWEGHTMFLPSCRGRRAVETGKAMMAWMFEHGAEIIWGQTPTIYRHVRWFNRQVGFSLAGIGFHHVSGEVERFVMRNPDGRTIDCRSGHFGI
ncbi:hypothetical protein [Sphingomonas melonis]|uniref:N-acetyltransferase domain-containing protein n=1 Tax=Sphingomonas melonis TaxID=152682 RepID=A0A7Y9FKU2_9SPHN|nr:hypothetical protein [Sphingomonas melonis]NYD88747.1 hypothetical protein [Sphingomonas melonis]